MAVGQEADDRNLRSRTLQLHHLSASPDQACGMVCGILRRGAAHERQIGDDQCPFDTPGDAGGVVDHVVDGRCERCLVALDRHAQRVTDQHDIDTRLVYPACQGGVVGG